VTHAIKSTFVYELPFGQGKRFGTSSGAVMDRIIGGWQVSGTARFQTGELIDLGNVNVVGMSLDEVQDLFKVRYTGPGNTPIYMWPQDIIDNTIKAFSTSATSSTGYGSLGPPSGRYFAPANGTDCLEVVNGDCAPRDHYVTGPKVVTFDLSAVKRITLVGHTNFEFRAEMLNAFNNINFTPVAQTGNSATIDQITAAQRDVNNTQNPGGRLVQFVFRVTF
jgi:hypothetical protein